MKRIGIGIQRLQHNIVDLFPGIMIQTDEAFTMDEHTHTHTHTHETSITIQNYGFWCLVESQLFYLK